MKHKSKLKYKIIFEELKIGDYLECDYEFMGRGKVCQVIGFDAKLINRKIHACVVLNFINFSIKENYVKEHMEHFKFLAPGNIYSPPETTMHKPRQRSTRNEALPRSLLCI